RAKGVKITDTRVRLTTEVLQGIRLLKMYAWEEFYANQIETYRAGEIAALRTSSVASSILIASISFIPVVATVLTFITYSLTGHDLNIAVIFSSLQLFTILRIPFLILPMVLTSLADLLVALTRISTFLSAEELEDPYVIDESRPTALEVDGDFTWEATGNLLPTDDQSAKAAPEGKNKSKKDKSKKNKKDVETLPTVSDNLENEPGKKGPEDEKPFELKNLKLSVPKGSFVAIVGRVGSGKSSVLQSIIGEMRRTRGSVVLGGTIAYVPQARVSLARAVYSDCDVVLLDDPLSAVDAYVGKGILDQCLLSGPLSKRTRILVTHALHVLDKTDYIYVMDRGAITEHGTYEDLIKNSNIFASLMEEYGRLDNKEGGKLGDQQKMRNAEVDLDQDAKKEVEAALMQAEERNTGAVSWSIYKKYLEYCGGIFWAPVVLFILVMNEASQVGTNLFLGFWTGQTIKGFSQDQYMGVYAGFGVAQALFSFLLSLSFFLMSLVGSLRLFKAALRGVLHSPISFFDTTPMGRIQSRLSKDQDTLDTEIAVTLWQFLSTFASVLGTMALVFYTFPLLGIIFAPLIILYYLCSVFYRRTSVETKRLDSLLRSTMYGSYSETLTGLPTIRAYRQQDISISNAEQGLDKENRAYYMTITIQRWLSLRLDFFGNMLVLGIALFAAGFRHSVNPAKIGVVLSYTLAITQTFSEMVNQFAKNEQNMNAVERVLHYTELSPEAAAVTPDDPPPSWPSRGEISFQNVNLAYRHGLPLVLKDVSFKIRAGEKIGIVGRTGAGKSSLLQGLFRTVELEGGRIEIDGQDISHIGLSVLRNSLALVPQDSTMFLGTLRSNLDPQKILTDAELLSVLQRAGLLPSGDSPDPTVDAKFSLDATVGDEGTFTYSRLGFLSDLLYYDRVLVMDDGEVAEFDTVLNLYDNETSIFRSLCNEANLQRSDILRIREEHDETF
ncbi:hypothetical protein H0H93_011041, partial [Arthromyces matolae]